MDLKYGLASLTILFWPIIPVFWMLIHSFTSFFKKIGIYTYLLVFFLWLIVSYFLFNNLNYILKISLEIPFILSIMGVFLLSAVTILHIWTANLLSLFGIMGLPELSLKRSKLIQNGPYSLVRHPTYLAHTIMFLGIFLFTGKLAIAFLTFLDFLLIVFIIIPLEEKELLNRFGDEFTKYKKAVEWKIIPFVL